MHKPEQIEKKIMTTVRHALIGIFVAMGSMAASAQHTDDEKSHHLVQSSKPPSQSKKNHSKAVAENKLVLMEAHMKDMQDMLDTMSSAKTPEERQALMDAHMKKIHQSRDMMKHMGGMCDMPAGKGMHKSAFARQHLMEIRMNMMESMMQLMMDHVRITQVN